MSDDEPPSHYSDPIYRDAIHQYLGWLAAACLIAALHVGPGMILVWLAVALVLTQGSRKSSKP